MRNERDLKSIARTGERMRILHVSHLYPNDFDPRYGIAVKKAIEHVPSEFNGETLEQQIVVPIPLAFFPLTMLDPEWACFADLRREKSGSQDFHYVASTILPKALLQNMVYSNRASKIYKYIKHQKFEPDIIHCHTAYADGLTGNYVKKKMHVPYVLTVRREIDFENSRLSQAARRTIAETVRHADTVIAPSVHLKRKCLEHTGVDPILVPNGIDEELIIDEDTFNSRFRMDKNITVITAVGRFDDNKRMDLVLEVADRLNAKGYDIKLNLVGDGPQKEPLRRSETAKRLAAKVMFHGNLPHDDVITILRDSDIFFLPSRTETFGLVYLEAMAQGLPIVGTTGQGMDGLASDGEEGFFRQNKQGFEEAVEKLVRKPPLRREMGEKGLILAKNCTWSNTGVKLAEIYFRVFKGS